MYLIRPAAVNLAATHKSPTGDLVHVKDVGAAKVAGATAVSSIAGYTEVLPAEAVKGVKTAVATAAFNARVNGGIVACGLTLAADDASRNEFAQLMAHATNADMANVTITDTAGVIHTMTADAFKRTMAVYGSAYYALWAAYRTELAAIAAS